ncbi:hypothetical protein ACHAW6_007200 [Cyclotella cf. meneghiniana]
MSASNSRISPKSSLRSMPFTTLPMITTSTLRSLKESMASSRPQNLPITHSPNAWKHTVTTNILSHPAFGIKNGGQSCLYSLLMTSAYNILTANMPNTSCVPSKSITPSPPTGPGKNCWHQFHVGLSQMHLSPYYEHIHNHPASEMQPSQASQATTGTT